MSLHDIDKNNSNRITPLLNSADDVQQRMAQGTTQVQNSSDEAETDGLKFLERQIIAVQNGENKAIFGFYGAANKFGFKVAEDGTDVLTATDDQLLFNSEQNTFKIVQSGVQEISYSMGAVTAGNYINAIIGSATINHNLGYKPALLVYSNTALDANYWAPVSYGSVDYPVSLSSVNGTFWHNVKVDETRLTLSYVATFYVSSGSFGPYSGTLSYRYYLLQETAT